MMPLAAIQVQAAGTFAFRIAGPAARHRIDLPERVEQLLSDAAVVLLVALAATSALMAGQQLAGLARPAGVLVAGGVSVSLGPLGIRRSPAAGAPPWSPRRR